MRTSTPGAAPAMTRTNLANLVVAAGYQAVFCSSKRSPGVGEELGDDVDKVESECVYGYGCSSRRRLRLLFREDDECEIAVWNEENIPHGAVDEDDVRWRYATLGIAFVEELLWG